MCAQARLLDRSTHIDLSFVHTRAHTQMHIHSPVPYVVSTLSLSSLESAVGYSEIVRDSYLEYMDTNVSVTNQVRSL